MYCKYCGKEIGDDARYCNHCGKPQVEDNTPITMDDWREYVKTHKYKLLYIVYALLGVFFFLTKSRDSYYEKEEIVEDFGNLVLWVVIVPLALAIVVPFVAKWWKNRKENENQKQTEQ